MSDDAEGLRLATRADVEQTLSFALRYDGRKRVRHADDAMAGPLMALVLLSAVLSSGNSCLYGATRVLASLAEEGLAPVRLRWRNRQGAPSSAVTMSSCFVLLAVLLELLTPARLFALLLAASAMTGLVNWGIFTVAHLRLICRRIPAAAVDGARLWPDWAVLLLIAVTIGVMVADRASDRRCSLFRRCSAC